MKEDNELNKVKKDLINDIKMRQEDKIIELENAKLLKKLINNAETIKDATDIATLGTKYQPPEFHFDVRLENKENSDTIKYLKKREDLSFKDETNKKNKKVNKLIIGDNYDALLNLLIEYREKIDVIYIDPPYSKNRMGKFSKTNYKNNIESDFD